MKKTLLIAAAALVAGVVSSQAQVYSANIVGYVNVVCTNAQLELLANPLDDGTNTANSILASLPTKSTMQFWNGASFVLVTKTSSGFNPNPSLPPGTGFFVKSASNFTNTFVGNVVPAPGGNSSALIMTNSTLQLVGSVLPVSGTFNDVGTNSFNLNSWLPTKSTIQYWNGAAFVLQTKTSSGFNPNPALNVGQGFFVKSASTATWAQTLQ
jgi:hypothetical protein